MICTEDEAKRRWCPFVRFHGTPSDDCIPNRTENLADTTRCIGSACMAFRKIHQWRHKDDPWNNGTVGPWQTGGDDGGGDVEERTITYCGLAGKP